MRGPRLEVMRIYIPATTADLGSLTISARIVHAATPALAQEVADDDRDYLEAIAFNAAADDSLDRIAATLAGRLVNPGQESPRYRRVVIAADVKDTELVPVDAAEAAALFLPADTAAAQLPSALAMPVALSWEQVAAFHVDSWEAEKDVQLVVEEDNASDAGDAAFARLAAADLLWYDVSERLDVAVELGVAFRA